MFAQHLQWVSLAQQSTLYGHDDRAEGLVQRAAAVDSWEALSVEDREFLTACIRDVENGNSPLMQAYDGGDWAAAEALLDTEGPDLSGPTGPLPYAPDRLPDSVDLDDDADEADDEGSEAKGIDFDDEGWIGL
jgi:hypothetical protein